MPKIVRERVVFKISDVSVTADSGWRDASDKRVAELVDTFVKDGLYGVNILRRPRVVEVHGKPKLASDGNVMLLDGKHTFLALTIVAKMYADAATVPDEATVADAATVAGDLDVVEFSSLLVTAITDGVEVDVVEFPDDDEDLRVAYCAAAHDESSNKYKPSSIKDLVGVAMRYQRKAAGGSWNLVRDELMRVYGQRRSFVGRMLVAAQTLTPKVLELLERYGVPNSYVYDNSYFNGHGRDANKRLGEDWLVAVLHMYSEETTKGSAFSKLTFDTEVCVPSKHAERWVKDRRREFGSFVDSSAFRRVEEYLMSAQARPLVLRCMRLGVRLQGEGPNSTGDAAGIDQCRILVQSLQEAMGRKATGPGGAAAGISGEAAALVGSGDVAAEASSGSAEMLTGMEAEDTAKAAAMSKTEAAKTRFLQYTSFSELSGYLTRILVPSEKVIFFVDFITSKARAPLASLDDVGRFLAANGYGTPSAHGPPAGIPPLKVRIFVPTGSRLDLVTVIKDKLAAVAPTLVVYFLTLTAGPTQGRKRSYFLLVAIDPASAATLQIPHSIEALAIRARHGEGTRIRCLDVNCGLRSTAERQELELGKDDKGPTSELAPDHIETKFDDVLQENEEAPSAKVVVVGGGTGPRTCVRDLFPFAMPQDHYKAIFSAIVGSEASSHFVYLSSTAHPAALLAARDLNFQIHYVLDGCRPHSIAHGQKLLTDILFAELYAAELKSTQHVKRVHEDDVRFIVLTAPNLQTVRFDSVPADKNWRSGEDNCPGNDFLETNLPRLFSSELDKFGIQSLASTPSIIGACVAVAAGSG